MQRVIPGVTLCEGWTWVDVTGKPPTIVGELFNSRRGAIHQAEGTHEDVVHVSVVANGVPCRRPRVTAIGYMLLLSPSDDGIRWRVELFSRAGNLKGYITCCDRAHAAQHRGKIIRLHQKLADQREARRRSGRTGSKPKPSG